MQTRSILQSSVPSTDLQQTRSRHNLCFFESDVCWDPAHDANCALAIVASTKDMHTVLVLADFGTAGHVFTRFSAPLSEDQRTAPTE